MKSKSSLSTLLMVIGLTVVAVVTIATINESEAPIDLEISTQIDYRGATVGSTTLRYHWLSGELGQDTELETIDWQEKSVSTTTTATNNIDSIIIDYLGTATQSSSWLTIDNDGYWIASFSLLIGSSLPIYLVFNGKDAIVNDVSISCDVSLLPSGLKTALNNLGITNLDFILRWNLIISGDFLRSWFSNLFGVFREGINTVTRIGEQFVGSINLD